MISVRLAQSSDQVAWDNYVINKDKSWPYHLFAWKRVVEKSYSHETYYLIAEDNNHIVGVLPLIHIRFMNFINELTALPYCDVGGIVYDNQNSVNALLTTAYELGKEKNVDAIHLRGELNSEYDTRISTLKNNKVRMLLDLPPSSDELMNSFKSKLRSQIRKAIKNGLTFHWEASSQIDGFYSVFSQNMHDLGSPVHSKKWFRNLTKEYGDSARVGIVKLEKEIVGACLVLTIGNKISVPWASTLKKHNRLAPNMLLYWNMLKFASDYGYKVFDFGRSSVDEGTYKFKAQWGAEALPLDWYLLNINAIQNQSSLVTSNRRTMENIWRILPQSVANLLGPPIRKYISL